MIYRAKSVTLSLEPGREGRPAREEALEALAVSAILPAQAAGGGVVGGGGSDVEGGTGICQVGLNTTVI